MKVLNLYSGIGGNRKLWPAGHKITAVELNPKIAEVYADYFPNDEIVIADAHQYLLENFQDFEFIWTSPPCQSHSQTNHFLHAQGVIRYPDAKLWQEIIFLSKWFKGKWVVENVKPYYSDMAIIGKPQVRGRHWFWANFRIPHNLKSVNMGRFDKLKNGTRGDRKEKLKGLGFDLDKYSGFDKVQALRNCVTPKIGKAIFDAALGIYDDNNRQQLKLL